MPSTLPKFPTAAEQIAESFVTGRSYEVEPKIDYRGTGLDWRVRYFGPGHWCVGPQEHAFQTEAEAEAAGRNWIITGRTGVRESVADRLGAAA